MSSETAQLQQQTDALKLAGKSVADIQQCLDSAKRMEALYKEQTRLKEEWDARQQFWTVLNRRYQTDENDTIRRVDEMRRNPEKVGTEFEPTALRLIDNYCSGYGTPPCDPTTCAFYEDLGDECFDWTTVWGPAATKCGQNYLRSKKWCKRTDAYYDEVQKQNVNNLKNIWNQKKFWCDGKDCYCQGTGNIYDPITTTKIVECNSNLPTANAKILNNPSGLRFGEDAPIFETVNNVICADCSSKVIAVNSTIDESSIKQTTDCVASIINKKVTETTNVTPPSPDVDTDDTTTNQDTDNGNNSSSMSSTTRTGIIIGGVLLVLFLLCSLVGVIIYVMRSKK